MNEWNTDSRELIPQDFWVKNEASVTAVLTESHHLLLREMQFATFISKNMLNEEISLDELHKMALVMSRYIEVVESIMNAVENYLNTNVRNSPSE